MRRPMTPSFVLRPAFFAALARPFFLRMVVASSKLPWASASAALQSIIPAPVWSRSFFTISAEIAAVAIVVLRMRTQKTPAPSAPALSRAGSIGSGGGVRGFALPPLRPRGAPWIGLCGGCVLFRLPRCFRIHRLLHIASGDNRIRNARGDKTNRAQRIVVARHDEIDLVRIAVRVDDADYRDFELARLVDRDLLLLGVNDEDRVG